MASSSDDYFFDFSQGRDLDRVAIRTVSRRPPRRNRNASSSSSNDERMSPRGVPEVADELVGEQEDSGDGGPVPERSDDVVNTDIVDETANQMEEMSIRNSNNDATCELCGDQWPQTRQYPWWWALDWDESGSSWWWRICYKCGQDTWETIMPTMQDLSERDQNSRWTEAILEELTRNETRKLYKRQKQA